LNIQEIVESIVVGRDAIFRAKMMGAKIMEAELTGAKKEVKCLEPK
jgi:hypothetical protein